MFSLGLGLVSSLFNGLTGKQQAVAGLTGILLPIGLVIGGYFHGQNQYSKGFKSRNVEVVKLIEAKNDLTVMLSNTNTKLSSCNATNEIISKNNRELTSRIDAQQKQHIQALQAEKKSTEAAQQASLVAVKALTKSRSDNSAEFTSIRKQIEGLSYGTDKEGTNCIVRGGGIVLRNARIGKTK